VRSALGGAGGCRKSVGLPAGAVPTFGDGPTEKRSKYNVFSICSGGHEGARVL